MAAAVLFPRYDHPAVEESYASWQSEMLLRRGASEFYHYDFDEAARHAVRDIEAKHVLVVTDPLLIPSPRLAERLEEILPEGLFAAIPSSSQSANEKQRLTLPSYMTLRELEMETAALQKSGVPPERFRWDGSNPGAYLCRVADLAAIQTPLRDVLNGREVILSRSDFIHRWPPLRGDSRADLLERIAIDAKSILEFGCGEGSLGEALKKRQKCRVVGIELDRDAAARARKKIDDVYCGDALEIVGLIHEEFDWIVGGDFVEHLTEPWSFLSDLRRISKPAGRLLLSIPNIANASIVADLLRGRFDYVYMGLTCVGHLRFFTRRSIEDMLAIAGWDVEKIEPQLLTVTSERDALIAQLESAGVPFSKDELLPTGYYVTARNRR
ncbi:MAG TPA: class I SAM-dependent methyltransferase [Thermoanaerobaculia bacterium]|nr:class I SAM-dependent methyltransferase [Thermoanaerobaculia bacterium]